MAIWADSVRPQYQCAGTCYAADLTEAEFALIEPMLPPAKVRSGSAAAPRGSSRSSPTAAVGVAKRPLQPHDNGGGSRSSSGRATPRASIGSPKRWVIERTSAGPGRDRRLAEDVETLVETSTATAAVAIVQRLVRRCATV